MRVLTWIGAYHRYKSITIEIQDKAGNKLMSYNQCRHSKYQYIKLNDFKQSKLFQLNINTFQNWQFRHKQMLERFISQTDSILAGLHIEIV